MSVERLRNINDILLRSKDGKPLTTAQKAQFSARMKTYAVTGAMDGLEGKFEVIAAEHIAQYHTSHTHDTTDGSRCRTCTSAGSDGLGGLGD